MAVRRKVTLVNPTSKLWREGLNRDKAYILWFGTCGPTRLLVYAKSLEDALDECVGWLEDQAPGVFADDIVHEEYQRAFHAARAYGVSEETASQQAMDQAVTDMTICDGGHYIPSDEWGLIGEDLTPKQIADFVHDR